MICMEHEILLNEVCMNDSDAVACLKSLGKLFRLWDDVWDGDKPHDRNDFDSVFSDIAFDLCRNHFFKEHEDILRTQIFLSWNAWQDSNMWKEETSKAKRLCAWFIRDYCNEIVPLVAWLKGGKIHARMVSLKVREFYLNQLIDSGVDGLIEE